MSDKQHKKVDEKKLQKYLEKWTAICYNTGPADREKAESMIGPLYDFAQLKRPFRCFWGSSPVGIALQAACIEELLKIEPTLLHLRDKALPWWEDKGAAYVNLLEGGEALCQDNDITLPWFKLKMDISNMSKEWSEGAVRVKNIAAKELLHQLVGDGVVPFKGLSIERTIEVMTHFFTSPPDDAVYSKLSVQSYGNQDAGWLMYYDYYEIEEKSAKAAEARPLVDFSEQVNWWICGDEAIFISEMPSSYDEGYMDEKITTHHNDKAPLVVYRDGYDAGAMNNTMMPSWVINTPAEELPAEEVLQITNAQVRAEAMRKMGIERLFEKLESTEIESIGMTELYKKYPIHNYPQHGDVLFHVVEDSNKKVVEFDELEDWFVKSMEDSVYKLVEARLNDNTKGKFLVMDNLSVDLHHIEGVDNNCTNVFEAICFRNQEKGLPFKLT